MERLFRLHAGGRVGDLGRLARAEGLEVLDEALRRVLAPVEDEIVGEFALIRVDLRVGRDVRRIDHRQVEARFDRVVQEHGVEHGAGCFAEAEGDVRDPERCLAGGQLAFDRADAFERLDGGVLELVLSGGEREGQRVEDQELGLIPCSSTT